MKRKRNKELAEYYAKRPCDVCGSRNFVSGHHVKSFASGGACSPDNLISLCFEHHRQIHDIGNTKFADRHIRFKQWLISNGWEYDSFCKKWIKPHDNE